ncbi:hypothetical protein DFH29DRAFT_967609, partial [Suillus ampliporus]
KYAHISLQMIHASICLLVLQLISHQTLLRFGRAAAVGKNLRQLVVVFVGKGKEEGLDTGVKKMGLIFCGIGRWPGAEKYGKSGMID